MSEKPSLLEEIEKFSPGMKVVKIGPQGTEPEHCEILSVDCGRVKLRPECGPMFEVDYRYFLDNYGSIDTVASVIKVEDRTKEPVKPVGYVGIRGSKADQYKCETHEKIKKLFLN